MKQITGSVASFAALRADGSVTLAWQMGRFLGFNAPTRGEKDVLRLFCWIGGSLVRFFWIGS